MFYSWNRRETNNILILWRSTYIWMSRYMTQKLQGAEIPPISLNEQELGLTKGRTRHGRHCILCCLLFTFMAWLVMRLSLRSSFCLSSTYSAIRVQDYKHTHTHTYNEFRHTTLIKTLLYVLVILSSRLDSVKTYQN